MSEQQMGDEMRRVSFKAGDSVSYKVGRGRSIGTIAGFCTDPDIVTITTAKGKFIRRKVSELARS